jgi:hypothetical protein
MDTKLLKVIPPLNLKLQFQFNLFPSKFRLTKMYLHNTLEESWTLKIVIQQKLTMLLLLLVMELRNMDKNIIS